MGKEWSRESRQSGRTLHVVDIENLAAGPRAAAHEVAAAIVAYRGEVPVAAGDHALIACNANNAGMVFAAKEAWGDGTGGGCVIKVRHGHDGADRALLEDCDPARLAARYDRVVIGSGDHAFLPLVVDLRDRGLVVLVVSREAALCNDLGRAACVCHRLAEPTTAGLAPVAA